MNPPTQSNATPCDWSAYHAAREIEITALVTDTDSPFVPFDMSNNRATLGDDAGRLTWQASKECGESIDLLNSPERIEAWKDWVRSSGGWNQEEIDAMPHADLNALLLQWIAGDIREAFGDADCADWDWTKYREDSEAGRISSTLFITEDDRIYFSIAQ